ncbi:MAG TPA: Fic family protein, partial [Chlamydiales bacterium]|nr:Fic family protein [Chlamydiales bacterium]
DGVSIEQIEKALASAPPRRTLQRYLAQLAKNGQLIIEGNTKGRRYKIFGIKTKSLADDRISLSTVAESLQSEIMKPIQMRGHVNYKRDFLDAYCPNETFYLSEPIRHHLHQLGKTDGDRPAGTYARQIFNRLLIDLSWNSSRLEGNTYSLLETERLLSLGVVAEGKNSEETQMILNHKATIEFLVESAKETGINRFTILNIHALLADNLLPSTACGSLRSIAVGIGGSAYHPLMVPQLIQECFQQIIDIANRINNPFEQAFFLMVHLPYLQPFEDVNKRVSRLTANIPLIRENLCPLSFVGVPEQAYINGLLAVYELNRVELLREVFVWAYERSCALYSTTRKMLGEPDPFRLRYHEALFAIVAEIVRDRLDKKLAISAIKQRAEEIIPSDDRGRFIEVVENELLSLHKGNIARYRLRPSEFDQWQKEWNKV